MLGDGEHILNFNKRTGKRERERGKRERERKRGEREGVIGSARESS